MKKVIVFSVLAFGLFFSAKAQRLGLGLAYGSEVKAGGVAINGEFFLSKRIAISPAAIFYFDKAWEANGNLNFILAGSSSVLPYAIAGLNIFSSSGSTNLAANLGFGANYKISRKSRLFTEAKFELGESQQFVILGGIKFPVGG